MEEWKNIRQYWDSNEKHLERKSRCQEMKNFLQARDILKKGGIVAFPTDTVMGLAVNAWDRQSIDKLYALKKRDLNKPFVVFLPRKIFLETASELSQPAKLAIKSLWPGAFTLVFSRADALLLMAMAYKQVAVDSYVGDAGHLGDSSLGIRIPNNEQLLAFLDICNFPLAVTSANISTQPPLISMEETRAAFGESVDYYLDFFDAILQQGIEREEQSKDEKAPSKKSSLVGQSQSYGYKSNRQRLLSGTPSLVLDVKQFPWKILREGTSEMKSKIETLQKKSYCSYSP